MPIVVTLSYAGKTVLVTGAGRNIGQAVALEFASRGANLVLNVRANLEQAAEVAAQVRQLGGTPIVVAGDVSQRETVDRLRDEAVAAFGRVDIYISCAARRLHKSFFDTTDEEWHLHLNMQLTASWYLAKAFAPAMCEAGWGRIVHINGPDGWHGGWMRVPHSTAKGGLRTLTKSLAAGLGEYGVTVNDINPGFTATVRDPRTHPQWTPAATAARVAQTPIRRQPRPEEIAWACEFLCSDRAAAITGSVLHVDGGLDML